MNNSGTIQRQFRDSSGTVLEQFWDCSGTVLRHFNVAAVLRVLDLENGVDSLCKLRILGLEERLENLRILRILGLGEETGISWRKADSCKKSTRKKLRSPFVRKPLARP